MSGRLQERHGLNSRYFEALATADVFACDHVVPPHHVGLGFGETGAITLISVAGQSIFLTADEPAELVVGGLAAVGAGKGMVALLGPLVKEIPLFHLIPLIVTAIAYPL